MEQIDAICTLVPCHSHPLLNSFLMLALAAGGIVGAGSHIDVVSLRMEHVQYLISMMHELCAMKLS